MAIISSKQQPLEPDRQTGVKPRSRQVAVSGSPLLPTAAQESLVQPEACPEEAGKQEERLRPQSLSEYVGKKISRKFWRSRFKQPKLVKKP
ncbi:MAG TPA: hypothetical protein V6D04_10120 [Candidatus Obscuribacterales bacterium]